MTGTGLFKQLKGSLVAEYANRDHWIPAAWLHPAGRTAVKAEDRGEVNVDPVAYYRAVLDELDTRSDQRAPRGALTRMTFYGALVRHLTAWRHDRCTPSTGTLLKLIALMPYLANLGVQCLYLLPLTRIGRHHAKGELGSPFAVSGIDVLEPRLHDCYLGCYDEELLKLEFAATVEAAHRYGLRVIVDFSLRTVARDCDLLGSYPENFYWVHCSGGKSLMPPHVEGIAPNSALRLEHLSSLYAAPDLPRYMREFSVSPRLLDPARWDAVRRAGSVQDLLPRVESAFGLTTAPAFSDCINDEQAPWTDVTYLRFYDDDGPRGSGRPDSSAPYCLQDSASLNIGVREGPHAELIECVTRVPASWVEQFGIDGFRIDSAHALSRDINTRIVASARDVDPACIAWGEGFSSADADHLRASSYDLLTGTSWVPRETVEPEGMVWLGALEIHDTARAAVVFDDSAYRSRLDWLAGNNNCCLFINAGQELGELRPLNMALSPNLWQPAASGVLGLFDYDELDWLSPRRAEYSNLLRASAIRKRNG